MAVREFNGTTDVLVHLSGSSLGASTFGTFAVIFKSDTTTGDHAIMALHSDLNAFQAAPLYLSGANTVMHKDADSTGPSFSAGVWYLLVVRKATGTATPRFSLYNFNTSGWTHANGSASLGNWATTVSTGHVRHDFDGTAGWFDGRIAVEAFWSDEVHWTADGSGDTAVAAAGLEDLLGNWVDETPDVLWAYNQNPVSAVDDSIGDADQFSVTGTTAVTGDDPPGFSFSLEPEGPAPSLYVVQSSQRFR